MNCFDDDDLVRKVKLNNLDMSYFNTPYELEPYPG